MRLLLGSPVGPLLAEYGEEGLQRLRYWRQGEHPPAGVRDEPARDDSMGRQIAAELGEYFAGHRRSFTVPLLPEGTAFQKSVWLGLQGVPFGQTRSYAGLAQAVGRPGAARAVGQANARNPIPILIPCHRVLAADGGLGGYLGARGSVRDGGARSELDIKRWLLDHERPGPGGAEPVSLLDGA